jgi:hypothetical protein
MFIIFFTNEVVIGFLQSGLHFYFVYLFIYSISLFPFTLGAEVAQ